MSESAPPDYKSLDELPGFTRTAMLELIGKGAGLDVHDTHGRASALGIDVLVDVSWEESQGTGKDQRTVTLHRTVIFFHRPESKLPKFTISNHAGFFGRLFHGGKGSVAAPKLDFSLRPGFSRRYTITSPVPRSAEGLFTDPVLDALEQDQGLKVVGSHNGILAWRKNDGLLKGPKRSRLARDAETIFTSIVDDADVGARIAAAIPGTYASEMVARWKADGSKAARKLLARLVTREQVDALMAQPLPRTPPTSVIKRTMGCSTAILVAGFLMALIGCPLGIFGLFFNTGSNREDWWIGLVLILVAVVGVVMMIFVIRWRRRRMWLLRRGRFVDAKVTDVKATSSSSNNQILHAVTFEPTVHEDVRVKIKLRSDPTRIAQRLMYSEGTTPLLVDPDHPERGLWLEGWVVENIPD